MSYRILGIDPGSRVTGIGVIEVNGDRAVPVHHGVIQTGGGEFPERLGVIFRGVGEIIEIHAPDEVAVETVFVSKNAGSALKLGQARGVAIAAGVAHGLPVHEYAARKVKLGVVGTGRATKEQVQHMVRVLLQLPGEPQADAADALAIAICHVNTVGLDRSPPSGK